MAFRYEASTGHVAWEASPRGVGMRVRGVVLMIVAVLACVGLCAGACCGWGGLAYRGYGGA